MSISMDMMGALASGISSLFSNKATFLTEEGQAISVQFNPEQFRITKAASYNQTTQKENETSYTEFSGTVVPQMQISFFFDTSGADGIMGIGSKSESDVSALTNKFSNLVRVKPGLHRPPLVLFVWGSTCFLGFVSQVSTTYTMFSKDGKPIRAKVDAVLIGPGESITEKIPLESPDRTKARVVSDETSIWGLAHKEYDDISQWRVIAKANGIMDPFEIPAGTVLKVPALKE